LTARVAGPAEQEVVAVARRRRRRGRADVAVGAGLVVDHEGRLQPCLHLLGEHPRDRVAGAAAARRRHDQLDRLAGLRPGVLRERESGKEGRGQQRKGSGEQGASGHGKDR